MSKKSHLKSKIVVFLTDLALKNRRVLIYPNDSISKSLINIISKDPNYVIGSIHYVDDLNVFL